MSVPAAEAQAPASAPYGLESQRRQSIQEQVPQPQSYGRPPYQPAYTSSQVVSQNGADCYPTFAYGPPLPGQYHHPHPYGPPPQAVVPAPQVCSQPQVSYVPAPQNQPHQATPNVASQQHGHRQSLDHSAPSRRGSISFHQAHSSVSSTGPVYPYTEKGYARPQPPYQQYVNTAVPPSIPRTPTPGTNGHPLPPLKVPMPLPMEPRYDTSASSAAPAAVSRSGAPLPSPGLDGNPYKAEMYGQYPAPPSGAPEPIRSAKRPYATVFNAAPYEQSLRHGMRPAEPDGSEPLKAECEEEDEDEDYGEFQRMRMQYKRADGTEISRRLPTRS
jgi:hypothetical protein